jgi:hypothetical protein
MATPGPLRRFLQRDLVLAATVGLAVINGLPLTPRFDSISHILYLFTRGSALIGGEALFYLTSLSIAVMTLLLAGIPAAIYERVRGLPQSTPVSLGIWLVATALMAWPALGRATGLW